MIIKRLRANFGKLHGELELQPGMNLLCLPNEAGKSTWSAFLLAMLYGIDTSERLTKNKTLPAKERYKPWDGSAMEGSMELEWNGREITIERSSTARAPMGVFRAYETASGAPVRELTADRCGEVLCGVERSVFERTAFIRQLGLAVSEDQALEKRLGALVSTGEDGAKTALELEKDLRNLKNKLTGRAGRIPQLTAQADRQRRALAEIDSLQEDQLRLAAALEDATAEQARLTALAQRVERAQSAKKQAGLASLELQLTQQQVQCRKLAETAQRLPDEAALHALSHRLDEADSALQTAKMEAAFTDLTVAPPEADPIFAGKTAVEAKQQAEQDAAAYRAAEADAAQRLAALRRLLVLLPVLLVLIPVIGVLVWTLTTLGPVPLAVLGASELTAAVCLIVNLRTKAKIQAKRADAAALLTRYQVTSVDEILPLAERYAEKQAAYDAARADAAAQKQTLSNHVTESQAALDALVAEIAGFAPDCRTPAAAHEAVAAALRVHAELAAQTRAAEQQEAQLQSMRLLLEGAPAAAPDPEALQIDEAKLRYDLAAAQKEQLRLTTALAKQRGMIEAKGDAVALRAELEQTEDALNAAQQAAQAVELAAEAVQTADETLRSRFSPQITAEAGAILAELTEEKYSSLLLAPDMRLSVREADGVVLRPAAAMSCGTADQMYLALRLAMCRRLLPESAPLVLDDTLVNFDDTRAAAALRLLRQEAENRQILLFTCRALP